MDDPEAVQNLHFLRNMCSKEYTKLILNLPFLKEKIAESAPSEEEYSVAAYDETLECLTTVMTLLRRFNSQLEAMKVFAATAGVTHPRLRQTKISDAPTENAATNCPKEETIARALTMLIIRQVWSFVDESFGPQLLQSYRTGSTGVAILTYAPAPPPDADDQHQFVGLVDTACPAEIGELIARFSLGSADQPPIRGPQALALLNADRQVFGLRLDGCLFRAMRVPVPCDRQLAVFAVLLLDTGEVLQMGGHDALPELYELPEQWARMPPAVMRCRLRRPVDSAGRAAMVEFCASNLYGRVQFEVRQAVEGQFYDVLLNPASEQPQAMLPPPPPSPPPPPLRSTNPFLQPTDSDAESSDQQPPSIAHQPPAPTQRLSAQLTRLQRDQLFDRSAETTHFGTSNALVAVAGFNPADDERLCRHYDPNLGGCFKGARCRFEHSARLADGWTRDQCVAAATRLCVPQPWPTVGAQVQCVPTHIVHVNRFYGQLRFDGGQQQQQQGMAMAMVMANDVTQLTALTRRLNSAEMVATLRPFEPQHRQSAEQELVLARYTDGLWHRARVLRSNGDDWSATVNVFFVDYGNCAEVRTADLRRWDERFGYLPFQAYECRLAAVCIPQRLRDWSEAVVAVERVQHLLLHKRLKATVISNNVGELVVELVDSENFDMGSMICAMGLAEREVVPRDADHELGRNRPLPV